MNALSTLPKRAHLLGICGTAMTALADGLQQLGVAVTGSDQNVYPPMSDRLAALGIPIQTGYAPEHIPADVDMVVVGNVIQASNAEMQAVIDRGIAYVSMAQAIRSWLIGQRKALMVSGTHGKTTSTSLLAHVLTECGLNSGLMVGGIAKNFNSNFKMGGGDWFVIEGDEYDTAYFDKTPKFFKYQAARLIITGIEFDHADIYPNLDAILVQFKALLQSMPPTGLVIACADSPALQPLLSQLPCPLIRYGTEATADLKISSVESHELNHTHFTLEEKGTLSKWELPLSGLHNVQNATAVLAMARSLGCHDDDIAAAFQSFAGVRRRQELLGNINGIRVIEDFAHHPTAVEETLNGLKTAMLSATPSSAMLPVTLFTNSSATPSTKSSTRPPAKSPHQATHQGRLWAVFEPRSFTARSPLFQQAFITAFAGADQVLLAPAFAGSNAAQPASQPLLDTTAIAAALKQAGQRAWAEDSINALLEHLVNNLKSGDWVVLMSNGGFENLPQRLVVALQEAELK